MPRPALLPAWDPALPAGSPMLSHLGEAWAELTIGAGWPSLAALNDCAARRGVRNAAGRPIRFVEQKRGAACQDGYEQSVWLRGEVRTRSEEWHDLFNALCWLLFPESKAVLNAVHARELRGEPAAPGGGRGAARDAATLFDESGAIVAVADEKLAEALRDHRWKELFWERRSQTARCAWFVLFGHGLMVQALRPFPGLTAKAMLLPVPAAFFGLEQAERLRTLDGMAARCLVERLGQAAPARWQPLPLLGVPGWWPENERAEYYDDPVQFRPRRNTVRTGR